jgi:hypothetical protein
MFISNNVYVILIICFVVIASGIIIVYNTHMLIRDVDEFTNCNTGICSTHKANVAKCTKPHGDASYLNKFHNFNDIKEKHPLKLYGCTKTPFSDKLLEKLEQICYVSYQDFYSVSIYNVYEKIVDDVNKTKIRLSDEIIADPIYAIVYQYDNCLDEDDQNKFTKIIMVYPMYKLGNVGNVSDTTDSNLVKVHASDQQKQQDAVRKYVDINIKTTTKGCNGIVYLLNKNHKMFYDILKKTENTLL